MYLMSFKIRMWKIPPRDSVFIKLHIKKVPKSVVFLFNGNITSKYCRCRGNLLTMSLEKCKKVVVRHAVKKKIPLRTGCS